MNRLSALTGILLALAITASAAEPPPPAPPKGEADKPPRPEWRGGFGGFGRPPRHDGFDKLPEAERRKVRDALDRVWNRPEVIAARDEAMRANDAMRRAIREALQKTDPEAAAILARLEPREGFDPSKLPPLPPPEAADFPEAVVARMASELQTFSRPERREETRQMHERVMAQPALRDRCRTGAAGQPSENAQGRSPDRGPARPAQGLPRSRRRRIPVGTRTPCRRRGRQADAALIRLRRPAGDPAPDSPAHNRARPPRASTAARRSRTRAAGRCRRRCNTGTSRAAPRACR